MEGAPGRPGRGISLGNEIEGGNCARFRENRELFNLMYRNHEFLEITTWSACKVSVQEFRKHPIVHFARRNDCATHQLHTNDLSDNLDIMDSQTKNQTRT